MSYTDEQTVKDYLQIDNFTHSRTTSILSTWISAVERWINRYCNRLDGFEQVAATTKLYDGGGVKELLVEDLLTLTRIDFLNADGDSEQNYTSTDYWYLYPANRSPKTKVVLNPVNAGTVFPKGYQNIKLTGTFGHSASVPADIKLAATKLVAGVIQEFDKKTVGDIRTESLGDYSVTYTDIEKMANHLGIKSILDFYKQIPV